MPGNSEIISIAPAIYEYNGYPLPVSAPVYEPPNGDYQPGRLARLFGRCPPKESSDEMKEHNEQLANELRTIQNLDLIWQRESEVYRNKFDPSHTENTLPFRYLKQLDELDDSMSDLEAIQVTIPNGENDQNQRSLTVYRYIRRGNGGYRYLVSFEEQEKGVDYKRVLTKSGEYQDESLVIDSEGRLIDRYSNLRSTESDIQSILFNVNDICESPNGKTHGLVDLIQSVADKNTEIQTIVE